MRPLESIISAELANELLASTAEVQRTVASAATQAAVSLEDNIVEEGLADLRLERWSQGMHHAVAAVAEWLDEQPWALQSEGDEAGHLAMFRRARAAAAVAEAHARDPRLAVNEATYEAAHAVSDERFEVLITDTSRSFRRRVIRRHRPSLASLAAVRRGRRLRPPARALLARESCAVARAAA